ncbi:MAG TPA: beta-eliminating lyase-related protein [Caulobacteraceae bacterium]|nr:beta-eliminating lyase-related protein [Caulobacteraceae bacterium]
MARYDFASDNTAGAMPEALDALVRFNGGFEAGYGADGVSRRAADLIRTLLDADAEVWFTASGTAANALAAAALVRPHEALAAHEAAHVATDETGAPALFGAGLGIVAVQGASARIDPDALAQVLAEPDHPHAQHAAAVSLTQASEYGTIYSAEALARLAAIARAAGAPLHLDGARLANAAAAGFDVKAITRAGVAIAVVGGTKAGSTPTEALVLLDKSLERRFGARLKHAGQLVSKARFLAAPWIGMLESGAWIERARHANAMATRLAAVMPFALRHPVEANGVFVDMDEAAHARLTAAGWASYRVLDGSVRFMCSWATTSEAVDELAAALRSIA